MSDADFCESKHKGADTSKEAFDQSSDETRAGQRKKLLEYIGTAGEDGLTCQEAATATGMPYTTASARLSEMVHDNIIHDSRKRRPTDTGRPARVLRAGPSPWAPPKPPEPGKVEQLRKELEGLARQQQGIWVKIAEKQQELKEAEAMAKGQGELF